MTILRVLIVDDESMARRRLQLIIGELGESIEVVGQADGCESAVAAIAKLTPDIVLLDIRMRDGSGFEVLERMPADCNPEVIFVTAFDDSAVHAFEASATDYLLKPVEGARLMSAIGKARSGIALRDADQRMSEMRLVVANLRAASHSPEARRYEAEFWIRGHRGVVARVDVDSVEWAGVEDDYIRLHTAKSGSHLMRESVQGLLERLDPQRFVRIHRATIVRFEAIESLARIGSNGIEVVLRSGERLSAGRTYARALTKRLNQERVARWK